MTSEEKVVVVTGAGGGMGGAVVQKLLQEGNKVIGLDISLVGMDGITDDNFWKVELDLLDESKVKETFATIFAKYGKIDGLVNIAGIAQSAKPINDVTLSEWNKLMAINATGTFLTCKEAVYYMKQKKQGSIVNIGSVSVARPRPGLQSYIATKGAIEAFSKGLAIEVAPDNIRVNILHPGPAQTNMLGQFSSVEQQKGGLNMDDFKNSVPLGELIHPTDIAAGVSYLLSDGANMVTGTCLHVDGGRGL